MTRGEKPVKLKIIQTELNQGTTRRQARSRETTTARQPATNNSPLFPNNSHSNQQQPTTTRQHQHQQQKIQPTTTTTTTLRSRPLYLFLSKTNDKQVVKKAENSQTDTFTISPFLRFGRNLAYVRFRILLQGQRKLCKALQSRI